MAALQLHSRSATFESDNGVEGEERAICPGSFLISDIAAAADGDGDGDV